MYIYKSFAIIASILFAFSSSVSAELRPDQLTDTKIRTENYCANYGLSGYQGMKSDCNTGNRLFLDNVKRHDPRTVNRDDLVSAYGAARAECSSNFTDPTACHDGVSKSYLNTRNKVREY